MGRKEGLLMLAVKGGKILTVTRGTIDEGTVLIENGKFIEVGQDVPFPPGTEVVDARGKWVVPGFIDCHCHVGIVPEGFDWEYSDVNETTNAVTGHVRAIDGIDFHDKGFQDALDGGVTAMIIHPGSANVICGTDIAVKAAGESIASRVLRDPAGMKMAWTAGGRRGPRPSKDVPYPSTRMGVAAILRQYLVLTQEYLKKLESGEQEPEKDPAKRFTFEILAKILKKEMPARIHSMTPADLYPLFRLQDEFGFDFTVDHGDEAYLVASELSRRKVPVNYGPFVGDRWIPMFPNSRPDAAKIMDDAGVLVSFQTDHPVLSIRDLRLQAAICVKYGLSPERAIRMLTINPATIMGLASRLGSIEPGKDADFSIFSGDPLMVQSRVEAVFIDGKRVK